MQFTIEIPMCLLEDVIKYLAQYIILLTDLDMDIEKFKYWSSVYYAYYKKFYSQYIFIVSFLAALYPWVHFLGM